MNTATKPKLTRAERIDILAAHYDRERTIDLEIYREHDCASRSEYLIGLAENIECDLLAIKPIVDMMGPEEDFDGTAIFVEDHADQIAECGL